MGSVSTVGEVSSPRSGARRFLAIPIPDRLRDAVAGIAPAPASGIRPVDVHGLHLTLHFLGDVPREAIDAALAGLAFAPFEMVLHGAGHFSPPTGDTVLWIGVVQSEALMQLHGELGERLRGAGLKTESRPFTPHLTLARCAARVDKRLINDWLDAWQAFGPLPAPVSSLQLYRSERVAGAAPHYVIEAGWPA